MKAPIAETFHSIKRDPIKVPTDTDKAFLAGIIEADGCISLVFGQNEYFHPRIQIANQSTELLDHIQQLYGGTYNPSHNKSKCFTLHWSRCDQIKQILEDTLPYLVSKREEGELLLQYAAAANSSGVKSSMEFKEAAAICIRIKQLHQGARV